MSQTASVWRRRAADHLERYGRTVGQCVLPAGADIAEPAPAADLVAVGERRRSPGSAHVTEGEADAWLANLEAGRDEEPPECHD